MANYNRMVGGKKFSSFGGVRRSREVVREYGYLKYYSYFIPKTSNSLTTPPCGHPSTGGELFPMANYNRVVGGKKFSSFGGVRRSREVVREYGYLKYYSYFIPKTSNSLTTPPCGHPSTGGELFPMANHNRVVGGIGSNFMIRCIAVNFNINANFWCFGVNFFFIV